MEDEIFEPLARYRDQYRAEHAKNTADFFEGLVAEAGVDEAENAVMVAEICSLEGAHGKKTGHRRLWHSLRVLLVLLMLACLVATIRFVLPLTDNFNVKNAALGGACFLGAMCFIFLWIKKLNPRIRNLDEALHHLESERDAVLQKAWAQMSPLNQCYDWDIAAKISKKTVPVLDFDLNFSCGRLSELRENFGWDDSFNQDKSVVFSQSGNINGNPFVLIDTLDYRMGQKTYSGSLSISWREQERDANGKLRWVTRHETLNASVTKPCPAYSRRQCLIYGNEAAPHLSFSRGPSDLSGLEDGFFSNLKKKRAIRKLESFSRNLSDDSNFTLMANREFDALFHARDRNHEVQFRLLFTPLAQQQMVDLLNDKSVGFGDDFSFIKSQMLNWIYPEHLRDLDMSVNPAIFYHYDLAEARRVFNQYHNTWFKALYFSLAPLLAIPLYQQHRSHTDIYKDVHDRRAAFWEHEAIANFHGEDVFCHPDSITRNILKTECTAADEDSATLAVTAYGFSGHERTDHISVRGGDGHTHDVPVHWLEYLPVQRTTPLVLRETENLSRKAFAQQSHGAADWQAFFQKGKIDPQHAFFRRSIVSGIPSSEK